MINLFRKKLPDCDKLFVKYFEPWYNEEDRTKMLRPNMFKIAAFEGEPLDFESLQYLDDEYLAHQKKFINETMTDAAVNDFKHITNSAQITFEALNLVDNYFDRPKIADIIKMSDPKNFSNDYLVSVCEFGVMIGQLFRQHKGFDWLFSHPYFRSIIVHNETGYGIPVFDWAVEKFSEYGVEDGFAAKTQKAIQIINDELE